MSEPAFTPGPWKVSAEDNELGFTDRLDIAGSIEAGDWSIARVWRFDGSAEANARLIAAAPDLLEAAQKLEKAETFHANCKECEGEGVPELCEECFPLFDDARVTRRIALAKAVQP